MTKYIALVDGKRGAYGVVVPDLPGCTTMGRTIEEALRNAVDAMRLWAEDARADGERLPRPRTLEALRNDPDVASALLEGAALSIVPLTLTTDASVDARLSRPPKRPKRVA
jgi:predicted RNase H-like HicB family nuclease